MLIALILPISAGAASVSLESALGFNGYFQLGAWTPLTVVIENRGRTLNGTLEVLVTSGNELLKTVYQTPYTIELDLPYNSTKLCAFTVLLSSFTHDVTIRFRQGEIVLVAETISVKTKYSEKPLAVVLDERMTPDFLATLPSTLLAVNARARFLPEQAYGYEGVAMLIVTADVIKTLRDRQFQALMEWVRQGGLLITSAGMNAGVFLEERLQQVLPLQIVGHQQVSALPALEAFCGQGLTSSTPFLVLRVQSPDAKSLVQEQDLPLMVERRVGIGKVIFVAFELQRLPFSRWAARQQFWENILALQPIRASVPRFADRRSMMTALLTTMAGGLPNGRIVMGVLAVYALVLKTLHLQWRKLAQQQWLPLLLFLVIVTVVSSVSYAFFFWPVQERRVAYNGMLHLHLTDNQQIAAGNYLLGIYALNETAYNFGFGPLSAPITPVLGKPSQALIPLPYLLQEEDTGRRVQGALAKWSSTFFLLTTPLDVPLTGQVQRSDQRVRLTIQNATSSPILAGYCYLDRRILLVGDIAPHSTVTRDFPASTLRAQEPFDSTQARALVDQIPISGAGTLFWQQMRRELTKEIFLNVHELYQTQPDTLVFLGWLPDSPLTPDFRYPDVIGHSVALVTWELPIER